MTLLASTMESVDGVQKLLDEWKGHGALLHSYTVSLGILEIAVTNEAYTKGIMVECLGVRRLTAPTGWPASSFTVELSSESKLPFYVLKDINAEVEVVADDIAIERFEDVKGRR
jgi:hypothetical protein